MPKQTVLDEGIASARTELQSHVGLDRKDAARRLVDFAARFAADPKLQAQALVLNLDAHGDMPDDDAADIEGRLHALIDEVVVDYLGHGGREALQQREHMHERLRERFLRRAPGESVAFRGEGIVKTYPGSGFTLGELDLTLRVGEITGVVGQNAHGKTTLLRIVAGELRPDRGTLAYPLFGVGDGDTGALDWGRLKANIAYVPQELPPWRGSLRDTLHYEAAIHGVLGRENEREVAFVVERLGLAEHLDKRWRELSGGYKLRFALARALVWKPRLLVMDEPLANLDLKAKSVLLQDVRDLARSYRYPIAVLMSSHELYDLEQVCQQMVFLREGQVVFVGPSSSTGDEQATNEFVLTSGQTLAELRARLDDPAIEDIREEGVTVLLRTRRDMDARRLLALLLAHDVDVQYFRDISRSVRRLFE